MKRGERPIIERMTKEVHAIRFGKGVTTTQLAADLEVSDRTIRRDLEFMRDRLGIGLVYDFSTNAWAIDPNAHLPWLKELIEMKGAK